MVGVRAELDQRMTVRDGTMLATDVHLPAGAGPFPTLIVRTPYDRRSIDVAGGLAAGFAVMVQDCRGRYESEGVWEPFVHEVEDATDAFEWCRRQSWCDGRLVARGVSYEATALALALAQQPDGLLAAGLELATHDVRDGWMYEGGALALMSTQGWACGLVSSCSRLDEIERAEFADAIGGLESLVRRPVDDPGLARFAPYYARWLAYDDEAYWRPLAVWRSRRRVDVPAFHVAGWFDPFCDGTLANYVGVSRRGRSVAARQAQRLVVGPWVHMARYERVAGDVDFGPDATGGDVPAEMLSWLRDVVDGQPTPGGARVFDTGVHRWRDLPLWPPPARDRVLFLSSGGSLAWRVETVPGAATAAHDPSDPVPTLGGRSLGGIALPGMYEQSPVEEREETLVFTSEALPEDLFVAGVIRASIVLSSEAASADIAIKVCDVHPDGRSYNLVDRLRRVTMTPGRKRPIGVDVGNVAHVFAAGHRVRIHVSPSTFPRLAVNPVAGLHTVHWGGRSASTLTLPCADPAGGLRA